MWAHTSTSAPSLLQQLPDHGIMQDAERLVSCMLEPTSNALKLHATLSESAALLFQHFRLSLAATGESGNACRTVGCRVRVGLCAGPGAHAHAKRFDLHCCILQCRGNCSCGHKKREQRVCAAHNTSRARVCIVPCSVIERFMVPNHVVLLWLTVLSRSRPPPLPVEVQELL